jgi:SulP family sulfate permease
VRYSVAGALFFASSNDLYTQFDYAADPADVVVDLSKAQVWDASTVAALDAITHKYAMRGKTVDFIGLDEPSLARFRQHTGQLGAGH